MFNSGGNNYRLVVWIDYDYATIYTRFIGTHAQYDQIDAQINTYGTGPYYIVVKNLGRGAVFSELEQSSALRKAQAMGARVVTLAQLHETSMRKIDRQNASIWAAINNQSDADALGMLERQRVKTWLRNCCDMLDGLPL